MCSNLHLAYLVRLAAHYIKDKQTSAIQIVKHSINVKEWLLTTLQLPYTVG